MRVYSTTPRCTLYSDSKEHRGKNLTTPRCTLYSDSKQIKIRLHRGVPYILIQNK